MLESLFIRVLNMSLTGSLMILAVLSVRFLLRKTPRLFSYVLWLVVLFRLLCPVSFESSFSLLGVLGMAAEGVQSAEGVKVPETTAMKEVNTEAAAGEEGSLGTMTVEEGSPAAMAMEAESPETGREEVQEKTFL